MCLYAGAMLSGCFSVLLCSFYSVFGVSVFYVVAMVFWCVRVFCDVVVMAF